MTKTLILFRHAKSSWAGNVEDHERPLADRGRRAAPVMAKWLAGKGLKPTVALVSTARRTQETWALIAPELGKVTKRDVAEIYEAPAERILDAIHAVEPSVESLIIVGHNPGMEDFARSLADPETSKERHLVRLMANFPKAVFARFKLDVESWDDVRPLSGRLTLFKTPKDLRD